MSAQQAMFLPFWRSETFRSLFRKPYPKGGAVALSSRQPFYPRSCIQELRASNGWKEIDDCPFCGIGKPNGAKRAKPVHEYGPATSCIQSILPTLAPSIAQASAGQPGLTSREITMVQLKPDRSAYKSRGSNSNVIVSPDLIERAGVAHELGNLIQIAASALNIIVRKAEADGHPVHGAAIDGARVSLDRAGVLVRNAIRQAGRIETTVEPIDVKRSLVEIGDLIRDNWAPGHRVDIRCSERLPAVRCLCLELQSAILNLALNARDSMPEGGEIIIEANAVLQRNMQQIVEVRVSDSGIGMSPDTIRRAFDPFFTTKVSGLGGVGLALVKRFAEDVGGSVKLFSEAGTGTTVLLRLPGAK